MSPPLIDHPDHYCVIGAGPSGLLAARALRAAGIPYHQYEKDDGVGGIWDIDRPWSPMYETAHFISSKTLSHLPGYPMPEAYPAYPSHRQILAYIQDFARAHDLDVGIDFGVAVERAEPDGDDAWIVTLSDGHVRRYRGLFLCSGNTWDPNLPDYPGRFTGESCHSVRYRSPDVFDGKRVLIVGAGNSGCDIACDAASRADQAWISMRRGYHFIPKFIQGVPADVFASRFTLPPWLERRTFSILMKLLVGDLRNYGLPEPDHRVLESHPIMNTQLLHHLGHGDIAYRPDISRFDGDRVVFVDGRVETVDLVVFATGYLVTYPYMARSLFDWVSKYPDLFLSVFHRRFDNVCCLGLHQTDGTALDLFSLQADMMVNFILDQRDRPARAKKFSDLKRHARPDLSGGFKFVKSARHATYVKKTAFKRYCRDLIKEMGWRSLGESARPAR